MEKGVKFFIVEDNISDAKLIERKVIKVWQESPIKIINHLKEIPEVLCKRDLTVVICDYMFDEFTGLDVLKKIKECSDNVLFYIVSGVIKEKDAAGIIEVGAKDFILKENLSRLVAAIKRDLKEFDKLSKHKEAEKILKEKQEELKKFNAQMVNREMRIIELKKEVNSLSRELGRETPYKNEL